MATINFYSVTTSAEVQTILAALWNFTGTETLSASQGDSTGANWSTYKIYYLDTAKTFGIAVATSAPGIGIYKNGKVYAQPIDDGTGYFDALTLQIEQTATSVIISAYSSRNTQTSINVTNCTKYIICNGLNTVSNFNENIIVALRSGSTNNTCIMLSSDVIEPTHNDAQNGNANVNAKTTNLIPFYNTASVCITTDVYQSLCEDIGTWYFGNVIVNDKAYRMSGSVFALDE